jgi:hypothetical protein
MITKIDRPTATDRLLLSAAAGDPSVTRVEEGVGPAGEHGDLAQRTGEVAVTVPVEPLPLCLTAEEFTPGANFAHGARCAGVAS